MSISGGYELQSRRATHYEFERLAVTQLDAVTKVDDQQLKTTMKQFLMVSPPPPPRTTEECTHMQCFCLWRWPIFIVKNIK